ncbi:hypothetical protein QR680_002887 [Steinernema hermaphroditum]|uniref:Nematode cuticle collagen N-terminal domain-containing protein n=1 Tax=Steinernema hermaphroditum TaxID=289476 RepID=A0AA39H5E2_9BILA|nr:hypothetical protein QR680_002887 [Steinernema hermaphroditum]
MGGTTAHFAAYTAVGFSVLALVGCSVFLPVLWNKINSITDSLESDMVEFRELQTDAWARIHGHNGNSEALGLHLIRPKRQVTGPGQCRVATELVAEKEKQELLVRRVHSVLLDSKDQPDTMEGKEFLAHRVPPVLLVSQDLPETKDFLVLWALLVVLERMPRTVPVQNVERNRRNLKAFNIDDTTTIDYTTKSSIIPLPLYGFFMADRMLQFILELRRVEQRHPLVCIPISETTKAHKIALLSSPGGERKPCQIKNMLSHKVTLKAAYRHQELSIFSTNSMVNNALQQTVNQGRTLSRMDHQLLSASMGTDNGSVWTGTAEGAVTATEKKYVTRTISEGTYVVVFAVQDVATGVHGVIKIAKLVGNDAGNQTAEWESFILEKMYRCNPNSSIVRLLDKGMLAD